jgi:hypothetical protein
MVRSETWGTPVIGGHSGLCRLTHLSDDEAVAKMGHPVPWFSPQLFGWVKAESGDADGSPGGWAQAFGEDGVEDFGYAFLDGFGVGVALDLGV